MTVQSDPEDMIELSERNLGSAFDAPPLSVELAIGEALLAAAPLTLESRAHVFAQVLLVAPQDRYPVFVNDQRCGLNARTPGLPPIPCSPELAELLNRAR